MALPNLSTLSLEVSEFVDTEAREEDVFEFNEQVDEDHPFTLHYDSWTAVNGAGVPIRKISKSRRSLGAKNLPPDSLPPVQDLPYADEPNDTIPVDYRVDPAYFKDERRQKLKWGFLFRQQRYSFGPSGERDSTNLPERATLKKRFERADGLAMTCLRTKWRGQEADVYRKTTATAVYQLKKAIENWHSLCYVVNGRNDVLGVMALGQLTRSVDSFGGVRVSNHQLKLPSEWINGMRKLVQQQGINRQDSASNEGQGNYTPMERFQEVQQRKLDFYIEWVCTASYEHVKNLPVELEVRGVGKKLLDGLKQFVREVYIDPCARAFLVEQWSLPAFETGLGTHYDTMQSNRNQRLEAHSVGQGLAWARSQIELWAFFDFIALDSAKGAWKQMGFCQVKGQFQPWNEALKLVDASGYYQGVAMFLPLVGFADGYKCEDEYQAPAPAPAPV